MVTTAGHEKHATHPHAYPNPSSPFKQNVRLSTQAMIVQRDAKRPEKGDTYLVSTQQPLYTHHVTLTHSTPPNRIPQQY